MRKQNRRRLFIQPSRWQRGWDYPPGRENAVLEMTNKKWPSLRAVI